MAHARNATARNHQLWLYAVGAVVILGLLAFAVRVAGGAEQDEPSFWMQKKMEYSEKILAGLAKADFEAIEKNSKSMNALSQLEKWVRAGSPAYQSQLTTFRSANRSLVRMAQEKDLDGATLAFMQLTQSCVQCHKVIRDPGK
jgi:cytochrome c556